MVIHGLFGDTKITI